MREHGSEREHPTPASRLKRLWSEIRARLRDRPDSEHEQQIIRVVTIFGMYAYMLWAPFPEQVRPQILYWSTIVFAFGLLVSLALFLHLLRHPGVSRTRRVIGILMDTTGVNAALLVGGTATTPFYPVLLWLIFGHGFRYGRFYLYLASTLSVLMFLAVITYNREWHRYPILSTSLVVALIILPAYVSILLRKLTDALRQAEEASRAKSRFLATMSHEFRTPLNAIIGMSELLARSPLNHEQRDMTATIRIAADTLLSLVNTVLDLARIESRRVDLSTAPFDLDRRLAQVRAMLGPTASKKGLYLRLRLDPRVPAQVVGAEQPLHQILVNLIANGLKFTERGGVMLAVKLLEANEHGLRLRFEVHDTGVGIEAEARERIFDRFTRAGDVNRHRFGGTGLGLAISRELVELMGGRIGVESEVGRGSVFWFELAFGRCMEDCPRERVQGTVAILGDPMRGLALADRLQPLGVQTRVSASLAGALETVRTAEGRRMVIMLPGVAPVDPEKLATALEELHLAEPVDVLAVGLEDEAGDAVLAALPENVEDAVLHRMVRAALAPFEHRPAPELAPSSAVRSGGARILLAEDNPVNQRVISRLLEHAGHRVETVEDGHGVLEKLEQKEFDLVLIDVNMPEMSGPETVKILRFTHDPAELPPLVALSADATPETRQECLSLGFTRYLTKPVDMEVLLATIDELVPPERRASASAPNQPPAPAERTPRPAHEPQGAAPTRTTPVLDERKLASLAELDRADGFLAGVVQEFLEDGAELVARMERAARSGDVREYRDAAHALKSSAAHIGARAVYERCVEGRSLDDHALLMRARSDVQLLRRDFERVEKALRAFLQEREGRTVPPADRQE